MGKPSLCLLVCQRLLRETEAVLASGGFEGVSARAYGPFCSHPQRDGQQGQRDFSISAGDQVLVAAEGCLGRSGKAGLELPPRCGLHLEAQCFHLMADPPIVDAFMGEGAYLLTPGWLPGWRQQLAQWGFDQATARDFFAESMTSFVLLDTGVDPESPARLEAFAAYVDRPFRIVRVGLGHYRLVLENLVRTWRLERAERELKFHQTRADRRVADEAMILDLMAQTTRMGNETEAAEHILGLFEMLFAPQRIVYASIERGSVTWCSARPTVPPEPAEAQAWIDAGKLGGQDEAGFFLGLTVQDELVGLLRIEEVAFPEHLEEYHRLAAPISQVCGLAISNARLYQNLHRLATTDPLTGLYNRRQFFELGAGELSRARRHQRPLAALMLDIDHFKLFNDRYGHQVGDKVLAEVARCLREEVRVTDVCGRYGGEEFAVLLPEADLEVARQAAERIRKRLENLAIAAKDESLRVTASLGVAEAEAGRLDLDVLLGRSDVALYRAKQEGRNRVCAWEGEEIAE